MNLLEYPKDKAVIDNVVSCAELASLMIPSPREAYVEEVCGQAKEFGFAGVLATPFDSPTVLKLLNGSKIETICIISLNHALDENFDCRMLTMKEMIKLGVRNYEVSVPYTMFKDEKDSVVEQYITDTKALVDSVDGKLSVIIEPEEMNKAIQLRVVKIAERVGVDYIRLGSGMEKVCGTNGGRATINTLCFLSENIKKTSLKAGGGWDYAYLEDCAEYIQCGASRVDVGPRFVEQLREIGYGRGE